MTGGRGAGSDGGGEWWRPQPTARPSSPPLPSASSQLAAARRAGSRPVTAARQSPPSRPCWRPCSHLSHAPRAEKCPRSPRSVQGQRAWLQPTLEEAQGQRGPATLIPHPSPGVDSNVQERPPKGWAGPWGILGNGKQSPACSEGEISTA